MTPPSKPTVEQHVTVCIVQFRHLRPARLSAQVWHLHLAMDSYVGDSKILIEQWTRDRAQLRLSTRAVRQLVVISPHSLSPHDVCLWCG